MLPDRQGYRDRQFTGDPAIRKIVAGSTFVALGSHVALVDGMASVILWSTDGQPRGEARVTAFEFFSAFSSIAFGLALTHILAGVANAVHEKRLGLARLFLAAFWALAVILNW